MSISTNNIPGVPINSITYPDHVVNLLVNYTSFKILGYSWTITISTPHTNITEQHVPFHEPIFYKITNNTTDLDSIGNANLAVDGMGNMSFYIAGGN